MNGKLNSDDVVVVVVVCRSSHLLATPTTTVEISFYYATEIFDRKLFKARFCHRVVLSTLQRNGAKTKSTHINVVL